MMSNSPTDVVKSHEDREDLPTWSLKVTLGGLSFLIVAWTLFGWLGLLVLTMSFIVTFVSTKIILTKFGIFPNLFPVGHFQMLSRGELASSCTDKSNQSSVFKSSTTVIGSAGYTICLICGDISCDRHPESHSISLTPWKSLLVQEDVNRELEQLVNKLVEYFVNSWYKELLKHKEADLMQSKSFDEISNRFIWEVKEIVRFLVSSLVLRLNRTAVEVPHFILHNLVKSLVNHTTVFIKGKRAAKSARFIEEAVLRHYRENYSLHPALRSSSCQLAYLRHLSDSLLPFLVPPKYTSSPPVRSLLREILFGVILSPIVEVTCQPECINKLFVALCSSNLDASDVHIKYPGSYVELLRDLSITGSVKAAVSGSPQRTVGSRWPLGIALKSILSDQQMLFLFMQFLKQEGAVNLIQFYLAAQDLTDKLCNPDLTQDRLIYLNREAQSVYHSFIHPDAIDLIIFSNHSQLLSDFSAILQSGKVQEVEKLRTCESLLDAVYEVSLQLEQTYCGLFFATSSYMKLVAGSSVASTSSLPLSYRDADDVSETSQRSPKLKSHRRQTSMSSLKKAMKESFWPSIDDGIIPASSSYHDLSSYRSASLSEVDKIVLPQSEESEKVSTALHTGSINAARVVRAETNDAYRCKSFTSLSDSRELKDMKNWQVSVSTVETRLDHNLKYFNVFIVKVKKDSSNSKSSQPIVNRSVEDGSLDASQWIVERRDHEFYALESKLKEFHGDSLSSFNEYKPLSANRNWQTLIAGTSNQKQSLDSKRVEFQNYLCNLIKCDKLKGSQLVYNFLSKADEFTADSLSLRKMIRSVPGKWTLEKGQNLDQFISRLLAKSLESPYTFSIPQDQSPNHASQCKCNEWHSNASFQSDQDDSVDVACETDQLNTRQEDKSAQQRDTLIAFDYLLWILHYFLSLDEKHFIVRALMYLEVVIRSSFESIVQLTVYLALRKSISSVPSVLRLLRYLNISLEEKMKHVPCDRTKDQKDLHKQASDSLVCWLRGIPFASSLQQPAYLFFTMTQYPMLNRQLIFSWIDDLIGFYFPQITQRNGDAR